jgi:hypothetical protein
MTACAGSASLPLTGQDAGTPDGPLQPVDASLPPVDRDASVLFDPCTSAPAAGYDPAERGLVPCCSEAGHAHCVPLPEVHPNLAAQLRPCEGGDYVCMPDAIIRGGGAYRPTTCTSTVFMAPGACISRCVPLVGDNPQAIILRQDGCAPSELCVPCVNPLDGTPTGACELIDLLCGPPDGDAGTPDAGPPACPHEGPPLLDPAQFPPCSPACGGAHCVPAALVPAGQQTLLASCPPEGGGAGFCAPDVLIETGGNFVPPTCESIGGAEGRCLSTCLPDVAERADLLPRATCGAGERCVPCYDPTSADPTAATGACSLACDRPTLPPLVLTCPWTGPPLVDPSSLAACSPACGGAHCVPGAIVPAELQALLRPCAGGFCAPDSLIATGGNSLPRGCRSVAGAEGRCLSTCIPLVAEQADVLPRDACDPGEACVPCFDPTAADPTAPTGACGLACDAPAEPPLGLECPWTGPPVIDPAIFPACAPACGGAHCVPADRIPGDLRPLLAACPGGYCAPDDFVAAGGQLVPPSCRSLAGVEGRCLSECLPPVAAQAALLPRGSCGTGERCVPCFDPTAADPMAPTGACAIACDEPAEPPAQLMCPWTGPPIVDPALFPPCTPACGGARCVPADMVPAGQRDLLAACEGGYCAPEPIIATAGNFVPASCRSIAGAEGRCLSTCLPDVADRAALLPRDACGSEERCVPCFDPTATDPFAATGACGLGCDQPRRPPVVLTCPWTGPPVVDAAAFPPCSACAGMHCVPAALIPEGQRDLLAPCAGGYCAPDPIITTANNYNPPSCRSVAGAEGRCLSECLPDVAAQPLLPRSTCATGQRCVPCFDPTSGDPTAATGACGLGCDAPAEPAVELSCPWEGPAVIVPSQLPACSPACAGAHCLPAAFVPQDLRDQLAPCAGGFCTPDPLIQTAGEYVPPTCTSIAGAEGRCLSECLPAVAGQPLLPQSTCAANHRCVPCFDPTSGEPTVATGACDLACDAPAEPPVVLECPWTGPAVIDPERLPACDPPCGGAHCLPAELVPGDVRDLLEPCAGGYCTPDPLIESGGFGIPRACRSVAGAEGRCMSRCLPDVKGQPLLPRDVCPEHERCVPCFDPTSGAPTVATGACDLACDGPAEPPVILTCPWTGPDVIDPTSLPGCCPGAHCLPDAYVPEDFRDLLAPCPGGRCTPDVFIRTAGETKPTACTAFDRTPAQGRCLSSCLPIVAGEPSLERSSCTSQERCAPCHDPFTGQATGACEIGCDTPPATPYTFPGCCFYQGSRQGRCIPKSQIPDSSEGNLEEDVCPTNAYLCIPDNELMDPPHRPFCQVGCVFGLCLYSGTCYSNCLDLGLGTVLPQGSCPGNYTCVP